MSKTKIRFNLPQMKRSSNELVLEAILDDATPQELRYEFYKDNFSKNSLEVLKEKMKACKTELEKLALLKKEAVNLVSFAKTVASQQQLMNLKSEFVTGNKNIYMPGVTYEVGKDITKEDAKRFCNWKYPCKWIDNSHLDDFEKFSFIAPEGSRDIRDGRPVAEYVGD